jgi:hypothetical protein
MELIHQTLPPVTSTIKDRSESHIAETHTARTACDQAAHP